VRCLVEASNGNMCFEARLYDRRRDVVNVVDNCPQLGAQDVIRTSTTEVLDVGHIKGMSLPGSVSKRSD
jgi:hypothetical protein